MTGKKAGDDKRLARQLEQRIITEASSATATETPLGPMSDPESRRLLISLITTLNASFPDYDFSDVFSLYAAHMTK